MEGPTFNDYLNALRKVIHVIKLAPEIIISDFEKAERKVLQTIFPRAKVIGCFFHYSQAIKDNNIHNNKREIHVNFPYTVFLLQTLVHNIEKHNIVKDDKKESVWIAKKLLIFLAFLPEYLIEEAFEIIK